MSYNKFEALVLFFYFKLDIKCFIIIYYYYVHIGSKGNYCNESHYYDPFSPTGMADQPIDSVPISSHASSCDQPKNNKSLLPTQMPASSRASVMFPILDDTVQHTYKNIVDVPLGDNSHQPSVEFENFTGSIEGLNFSPQKSDRNEDLYTWMAKQEFINHESQVPNKLVKAKKLRNWVSILNYLII